MTNTKPYLSAAIVVCAAVGSACERAPVEPEVHEPTSIVLALTGASLALQVQPGTSVIRECEAGGRVVAEGTASIETHGDVLVHRWQRLVRHDNCGLNVHGALVIVSGEMQLTGEAHFGQPVNGRAPLLQQQSRQVGSMTTSRRGDTHSCDYDLAATYDAARKVYNFTGFACGRSVQLEIHAPS